MDRSPTTAELITIIRIALLNNNFKWMESSEYSAVYFTTPLFIELVESPERMFITF